MLIAGLMLNVLGTLMIFFFGLPQPPHDVGFNLGLEDKTPVGNSTAGALRAEAALRKRAYRCLAYAGLTLLLVGFVLQLAAAVS